VASLKQFKLPDVGEGLTEAEIVRWHVQPGQAVKQNQIIVEIETAKALVELPCPFAGVVSELLVTEGTTVDVGTPIISIDVDAAGAAGAPEAPATDDAAAAGQPAEPPAAESPVPAASGAAGRTSVLVGYGPRSDEALSRRRRRAPAAAAVPAEAPAVSAPEQPAAAAGVRAKPPVRKLARDLGIDLHVVPGSGPEGTITRADVEQAAHGSPARASSTGRGEERIAVHGVRKATAQAMVSSAFSIPHVTEFATIDVSRSMRVLDRLRDYPEFAEVKVSPLLIAAKAVLLSLQRYPMVNSWWDESAGEIVVRHYVNLGIAAATPRGLVVPNIKDADTLPLVDLAKALNVLASTARDGRTGVSDMQRGTFTITNVGVFGVDTGTPIINPGEAAILALGTVRRQPWVHKGKVRPRWVTTLGLSFDHRIVDGELGSRFLRDVAMFLEDPAGSLLAGM
jgi:2-oxoisovalerate dehydrogenase E2 component (dihydrolipoyl transacylase)